VFLVALAAVPVAGFAPAPFPRPRRDEACSDIDRFQGTWQVVGYRVWTNGVKQARTSWATSVAVNGNQWTLVWRHWYLASHQIKIDSSKGRTRKQPCRIEGLSPAGNGEVIWRGLIRRAGDKVEIILSRKQRPEAFDGTGKLGTIWYIVLQRVNSLHPISGDDPPPPCPQWSPPYEADIAAQRRGWKAPAQDEKDLGRR
jgi:hypothetical protein